MWLRLKSLWKHPIHFPKIWQYNKAILGQVQKMAPEPDIRVKNKYPCTSLILILYTHFPSLFIANTAWGLFFLHLLCRGLNSVGNPWQGWARFNRFAAELLTCKDIYLLNRFLVLVQNFTVGNTVVINNTLWKQHLVVICSHQRSWQEYNNNNNRFRY